MDDQLHRLEETVTLSQAKSLITAMAHEQSLLLLSPPGTGKSDSVAQAAAEAGLPCRSLLGTQIAPEDVSGVPRIVGERSVFCPPRILLPEKPEPFCLFLDELPACAPDVQKAFYSLLLERRLGEHSLPKGTWVVAAGNRLQDRALVRALSSALVNRVFVLQVRADLREWLAWARQNAVRSEVLSFITFMPEALVRPVPVEPLPFSTPRAWASLSQALDRAEQARLLEDPKIRRALAFGRVSPEDAAVFCAMAEEQIQDIEPPLFNIAHDYIINDMLAEALGRAVPANGLSLPGARLQSVEALAAQIRGQSLNQGAPRSWQGAGAATALGSALRAAGLGGAAGPSSAGQEVDGLDVLDDELELRLYPDTDRDERAQVRRQVREAAAKSVSLDLLKRAIEQRSLGRGARTGESGMLVGALRSHYRPPWELGLQRWMEAVAPGPRTYSRPSRRGADRSDLVLVGRRREGWTLHVVLDTSGSMTGEFEHLLGTLAVFCESMNVGQIHMLQCDVGVTKDEWLDVEELDHYRIEGLGGSDMSPALLRLAEDPQVEAAIVLTDGYIDYPAEPMPYAVLWVLTDENWSFEPGYGQVLRMHGPS